jgi:hypothetical protein
VRAGACFAFVCASAVAVHASVITVTNANDTGPGSLRQALADAHDGDTITFAVTGTIGLTGGELMIDKSVTINGPGSDNVTVDGNHATRVFHVSGSVTVTISDLTIANGVGDNGGGVYNDGGNGSATLTIIDSTITGNGVGGGQAAGGGIYNNDQFGSATLTIINSTISGNSAIGQFELAGAGGGIAGGGTILNSTIAGNHAALHGGGISGGGTITNCTIRNNSAGGGQNNRPGTGGGIDGGGTITNCTISGNSVFGNSFKGAGAAVVSTALARRSSIAP